MNMRMRCSCLTNAAVIRIGTIGAVALVAAWDAPQAEAGTYTAFDQNSLNTAIGLANGDGDPTSTITLTGDIALSSGVSFPAASKPITVDLNGHTVSGWDGPPGSTQNGDRFPLTGSFHVLNSGAINGGDGDTLTARGGGAGLVLGGAGSSLTNDGTISGGAASGNSGGGTGAQLSGSSNINNGTIRGGIGGSTGIGGNGVTLTAGASLTNKGLIEGGAGNNSGGGAGVNLSSGSTTLINDGTIRGGASTIASTGNGHNAVFSVNGNHQITNNGTLEGGTGAAAIYGGNFLTNTANLTVINNGTIRAGAGGTDAILFAAPTGTNVLELWSNSVIEGTVVATAGASDTLRLGGDSNSSFNVSDIGATAQYRNFDFFEKTGLSTWTVTGMTTTAWTVSNGVLAGTATLGTLTNNAVVAPGNPATLTPGTMTVANYNPGAGGTLRAIVTPGGASQLAVMNTANLNNSKLDLVFAPGHYTAGSRTIVTTANGLGGSTFGTVTENSQGIYDSVSYDANDVTLHLLAGNIGGGGGNFSVAPTNGEVLGATSASMVLGAQASNWALFSHLNDRRLRVTDDNLRTAFAGSNPNQVAFAGDLAGLNAVLAQLPQTLAKNGGWFRAIGGFGNIDAAGPNLDSYGGGFMAGYDREVADHFLLGAAIGFSRTELERGDSQASINTPRVALYGSYEYQHLAVDASIGYGFDRIKSWDQSAGGTAKGEHDAHEIVAAVQAGYALDLPSRFVLTPRLGLEYLHIFEEGFTESGAGAFDLTAKSKDTNSLKPSVSLTLAKSFATDNGWYLTPEVHLTYSREMLDNSHNAQVVVGGGNFTLKGVKPTRDQLALGTNLVAQLSETVDLYGGYTALLPIGNTVSHNFEAGLHIAF